MLGNHTQHSDTHLPKFSNRKSVFRGMRTEASRYAANNSDIV